MTTEPTIETRIPLKRKWSVFAPKIPSPFKATMSRSTKPYLKTRSRHQTRHRHALTRRRWACRRQEPASALTKRQRACCRPRWVAICKSWLSLTCQRASFCRLGATRARADGQPLQIQKRKVSSIMWPCVAFKSSPMSTLKSNRTHILIRVWPKSSEVNKMKIQQMRRSALA